MSNFHSDLRGLDLHSPSNELVENNTGSAIPVFRAVKFTSIGTAYPEISLANGATDIVRGITTAQIENGGTGYVCSLGFLTQVNTSGFSVGSKLYAGPSGVVSNSSNGLPVGTVLKSHSTNGVVYVDNSGITEGDLEGLTFPDAAQLELAWNITYPSSYKVFTYDGQNRITDIDIYDDSGMAIQLFNKHINYVPASNLVSSIVVTSYIPSASLTKTLTYSGNLIQNITVTSSYG